MRWIVLGLAMLATPAAAADQFDLVCTAKSDSARYRVDLARGEWCAGDCNTVLKIVRASSGEIVFAEHIQAFRGDYSAANRVNRLTGEWVWYNFNPRTYPSQDIRGQCRPSPFSGLPTAKF